MSLHATLLLLLAAMAAAASPAAEKQVRSMDSTVMLMEKVAGLADAVYFRRDAAAVAALPGDAALSGFQGVLLGAPRRVDLSRETGLTALLVTGLTASRTASLPFDRNAIIVAVDNDRGTVFAGPAFVTDPSKSPEPPGAAPAVAPVAPQPPWPAGMPPPPEASSGGTAWLDVSQLLDLPRQEMGLTLRVVYFDQVSNAAGVEQIGAPAPTTGLSTADALALVARLHAAGRSQHRLPVFKRGPETPALDRPGAAFVLGRIGSPLPLHAMLRIQLAPAMLVQPTISAAATAGTPPPAAVLRAAVLVVMRDRNEPHIFPIEVPVWSPKPLAPGQTIDAAFSIDLATLLPPAAMQPGAQVYLLAGRHIAGPRALTR